MKILLITNYWRPFNASGTIRWLMLSKYINFDVLTSKKPRKGICDETLPKFRNDKRIFRIFNNLPAILSGVFLAFYSLRFRYDIYIYTLPPESLILGAWINEKIFKRKVVVDLRDKIGRQNMPFKFLTPLWDLFYSSMNNKITTMQHFDKNATLIRHGYMVDKLKSREFEGSYLEDKRYNYEEWIDLVERGIGINYIDSVKHYTSSSIITFRHLNSNIVGAENLHPELFQFVPQSWETQSKILIKYLYRVNDNKEKRTMKSKITVSNVIFVLWEDWATEIECIYGVYGTKEKAEKIKAELEKKATYEDKYHIDMFEVK